GLVLAILVPAVLLACGVFVLGLAPSARADAIYTYTGNPFFPSSNFVGNYACPPECRVTGSFTVPQPLPVNLPGLVVEPEPVTSFSFTDGNPTWMNTNAGAFFGVGTDSTGAIIEWDVGPLNNPQFFMFTANSSQAQPRDQTLLQCNFFPGCV